MSRITATFSGTVVAEPESKEIAGSKVLEFPVYVNHTKKNRETNEYLPTGDVSKIRVSLWREKAEMSEVKKGDIVEVTGTIVEKNFTRRDGTEGRSIQTDWVESVEVKYRKSGESAVGFAPSTFVQTKGATPIENAPF